MGIIDFRMRPLYGGYQAMEKNGTVDRFLSGLNCEKTASMKEKSLKLLVKEMDEAGVELAVVPGRQSKGTFISNEELFEIGRAYPGRFEIFPLYTPENPEESLKEIRTYIDTEGIKGVSIEPGFGNSLLFDDEAYEPLYQLLEEQEMILMATLSGSITPVLDPSLPGRFQKIAKNHPGMKAVAGHGGWPWVREMVCAAFFAENIYLAPDLYSVNCPGWQDWRDAAAGLARDKILFGSSYPLCSVSRAVENVKEWGLFPEDERKIFRENGAGLLGLK